MPVLSLYITWQWHSKRRLTVSHYCSTVSLFRKPVWDPPVDFLATSVCQHCGNINLDIRLCVAGPSPNHALLSINLSSSVGKKTFHLWLK